MDTYLDRPYRVVCEPKDQDEVTHFWYAQTLEEANFIKGDFESHHPGLYDIQVEEVSEEMRRFLQGLLDQKNGRSN